MKVKSSQMRYAICVCRKDVKRFVVSLSDADGAVDVTAAAADDDDDDDVVVVGDDDETVGGYIL